jgi:hypothetical protein
VHTKTLFSTKCFFIKFYCPSCVSHNQIRIDWMVAFRDRLYVFAHYYLEHVYGHEEYLGIIVMIYMIYTKEHDDKSITSVWQWIGFQVILLTRMVNLIFLPWNQIHVWNNVISLRLFYLEFQLHTNIRGLHRMGITVLV